MRRRVLPAFALAGACVGFSHTDAAQERPSGRESAADATDVRDWLIRIHRAASHRSFQGTFVVSAGGVVSSSRIAHYCDGNNQFERIEALDGVQRRVFRRNDVVHTFWPDAKLAVVEQRQLMGSFPSLLQGGEDGIGESYALRSRQVDRVAGHSADVLEIVPLDDKRFGYRLWTDKRTGLLLRSEVIGVKQEVLESSAFSEVTIGVKTQPEIVTAAMGRFDGFRVQRPVLRPTRLDDEGWRLQPPVPGFRQVSCVRRSLDGPDAGTREVVQSIYSDGLTHLSVFIEPIDSQRHVKAMSSALGATHSLSEPRAEHWVTVVGDVPMQTLRAFARALTRVN